MSEYKYIVCERDEARQEALKWYLLYKEKNAEVVDLLKSNAILHRQIDNIVKDKDALVYELDAAKKGLFRLKKQKDEALQEALKAALQREQLKKVISDAFDELWKSYQDYVKNRR